MVGATRYTRWLRFFDKQIGKGSQDAEGRQGAWNPLRIQLIGGFKRTLLANSQRRFSLRIDLTFKRDDASMCHARHLQTQSVALLFDRSFDFINEDDSLRRCIVRIDGGCAQHLQEYRQLPAYFPHLDGVDQRGRV